MRFVFGEFGAKKKINLMPENYFIFSNHSGNWGRSSSSSCIGAVMLMWNKWCSGGSWRWEWLAPLLKCRNKLIGAATDIKANIAGGAPRKD